MKPRIGDRVRITGVLPGEPNPIPVGTEGTVTYLGQWQDVYTRQIGCLWDNGSSLLLLDDDPYEIITADQNNP